MEQTAEQDESSDSLLARWFPATVQPAEFNFIVGDGAVYRIDVATKRDAINSLVRKLVDFGRVGTDDIEEIVSVVMRREELGSTGIGRGIAIPHAKHIAMKGCAGIIGHVPRGIDFDSLDGRPVKKIFLLLSPPDDSEHVEALKRISRWLRATV